MFEVQNCICVGVDEVKSEVHEVVLYCSLYFHAFILFHS